MATIVHFHVGADNPDRLRNFYHDLFGWKFTALPGPMKYELIETADRNGTKGVGGGMGARDTRFPGIINYFGVDSIHDATKAVEKSGGKIMTPPQEVPGWGVLAICSDPEGNIFGLFEEVDVEIIGN